MIRFSLFAAALLVIGCGDPAPSGSTDAGTLPQTAVDSGTPDAGPAGLALLGNFNHTASSVSLTVVARAESGLSRPRDLAFHPEKQDQLWVVNNVDDSMVIISNTGATNQSAAKKKGFGNDHFMPKPSALAFGATGRLATVHEEDQITQSSTPFDFMGPSLWPSSASFEAGHASHLDMLHNSPNATGIAWDSANIYWVFDGYHRSITRYDFKADHGPAGEDHSDGVIARYVEGQVAFEKGVSSHMELDHATGLLYIADTGNGRIAVLDTLSGSRGGNLNPNYDGCTMYKMESASLTTLVAGADVGLLKPSGLALRENTLFVSDNQTSKIFAFDLTGKLLDWVDLSETIAPGSLMGIAFDSKGHLYMADAQAHRVLSIAPASN